MTAALRAYADRGVFRGFTVDAGPRGRIDYTFTWLFRQPMHAAFDPRRRELTFTALLPGVAARSRQASDLERLLADRRSSRVASHKRIDGRRLAVTGGVRRGAWSLVVAVRGSNHALAVRTALALVNDVFLLLQENHPDYLVAHFGLSPE